MRAFSLVLVLFVVGCHGEPPTPNIDGAVSPIPPPGARSVTATDVAPPPPSSSTATPPPSAATASSGIADAGDPGALPQTHDKPEASGAAFEARAAALWDAIVSDDPERGLSCFFPVTAYEQVKAIGNPAGDWRHRLVGNFRRDVHALHKRLGDSASSAKFLRLDVPTDRPRWVEPNEESNKLGYFRVYGTRIVYEVEGKERTFDVSSLISWRGEWYVVHLTGFK